MKWPEPFCGDEASHNSGNMQQTTLNIAGQKIANIPPSNYFIATFHLPELVKYCNLSGFSPSFFTLACR